MSKPTIAFDDPEVRICTLEELAEISGWDIRLLRRAARAGLLEDKGVLFVPSDTNPERGTFMCSLKPFLTWFRGEAVAKRTQTSADTAKDLKLVHTISAVRDLLDNVA